MSEKFKIGQRVKLPFGEEGIIFGHKNIPWGYKWGVVKTKLSALSSADDIVEYFKDEQLELLPVDFNEKTVLEQADNNSTIFRQCMDELAADVAKTSPTKPRFPESKSKKGKNMKKEELEALHDNIKDTTCRTLEEMKLNAVKCNRCGRVHSTTEICDLRSFIVATTPDSPETSVPIGKIQMTEEQFKEVADYILGKRQSIITNSHYNRLITDAKSDGYIVRPKTEEPLIVHNIMSYKGHNYLKQPSGNFCHGCHFRLPVSAEICSFTGTDFSPKCTQNTIWKSFRDIDVNDNLACMRKDIGDVYLKGALSPLYILKGAVRIDGVIKAIIYIPKHPQDKQLQWATLDHLRLATAEELQKHIMAGD